MKSVNTTLTNRYRALLLVPLILGIGACAFNGSREAWHYDGSQAVALVETQSFLPVRTRDDSGQLLPYEAMPNPYTAQEGRIDKQAVTDYINARRAFNAQKYAFADQLLADLVEREPRLSGPRVMRGDIALARGDLPQAVEHYAAAVRTNPVNFNAYLRLAKAQRMRGHFHHAQNTYARALQHWPDGPELHLNLGVLYDVYLNMPAQARAHMEAYQLLSGDNSGDVVAWLEEIRQRTAIAAEE